MNFIKKLFSAPTPKQVDDSPRERPADWDLTLDDLFAEMEAGKRDSIGSPEGDWAKEYERSLIPEGTRFPVKGDLYESNEDQIISYMTAWSAPFTGEGEAKLLKGERIWIKEDPSNESALVNI